MSKCPVCKNDCSSLDRICSVCGFPNPVVSFVSLADAEEWRVKTLEPCLSVWNTVQNKLHSQVNIGTNTSHSVFEGDAVEYRLNDLPDGTVEIAKFVGFETQELIVPNRICGKSVSGIGVSAFEDCKEIEVITITEGIQNIEPRAFAGCTSLRIVNFPTTLKRIGINDRKYVGSFSSCNRLNNIICPPNLKEIGAWTFMHCESLTSISINDGLDTLGEFAFSNCKALSSIYIPNSVIHIGPNGVFMDTNNITILCNPGSEILAYARKNRLRIAKA